MNTTVRFEKTKSLAKIFSALGAAVLVGIFTAWRIDAGEHTLAVQPLVLPVNTQVTEINNSYKAKRTFTGRSVAGRNSPLAFELGGTIESVYVDIGSSVSKGDALAALDTARLDAHRAQLNAEAAEVIASLALAERTLERAREMFKGGHTSSQRLEETEAKAIGLQARNARIKASIRALNVDLAKSVIMAPYDGTVTARLMDEGTIVAAGSIVIEITENGQTEAHIGMPPQQAESLLGGANYYLLDSARQRIVGAKVRSLVPVIDGGTRTMLVTFDLPKNTVQRGELITAVMEDNIQARGAWVPLRALSADVRGLWRIYRVIEKDGQQKTAFEAVQILYTSGENVFVSGTLSNGDIIVTEGIERLAPGQFVTIAKMHKPSNTPTTNLALANH